MPVEQKYCDKCEKMLAATEFYTYKDGTKCELCKKCLSMHIDNYDESTYLWILEKFDVPYVPPEWTVILNKAYAKDPYKINGMTVIGKYLTKMRLKQWNKYGWKDTERLQAELEAKKKSSDNPNTKSEQDLENMRQAFERGEITESQYQTYVKIRSSEEALAAAPPHAEVPAKPGLAPPPQISTAPAPIDFAQVEIPDIGADLTEEDRVYLALKWGRLYTPEQWVWLEQKYNNFMSSFDIQGEGRIDTLIFICKTSLKMNDALDSGDIESYQKLAKVYDAQMKSAKFTEAQNKEEKEVEFDAVGMIVDFCEEHGGIIEDYKIDASRDVIDSIIDDNRRYIKTLFDNDPHIIDQIEDYLKKLEIREQMKKDKTDVSDSDFLEIFEKDEMEKKTDQRTIVDAMSSIENDEEHKQEIERLESSFLDEDDFDGGW